MKTCFATIISANYLAYAGVLRDSLSQHAPSAGFQVLLVDRPTDAVRAAVQECGLAVTYAGDLDLPDFEQLAYRFDLVEFNTALKPTFLKHLLAQGHDAAVYVDPDICFYAAPTPVLDALAGTQIVLIPHALAPVMDGQRPSDIDFLRLGSFNLGFIGVRAGAHATRFLDWWEARCLNWGFNDPTFGVFVDQKWIDLVPAYFEQHAILRHPGCNVAYWNLHERSVERSAEGLRVDGQPLVFFHFSGLPAASSQLVSRHQNRHRIAPGGVVEGVMADYRQRLAGRGHARWSQLPYGYGALDDGTPLTANMRRAALAAPAGPQQPFAAPGDFQRGLRTAGLVPRSSQRAPAATTLDVDLGDWRVRAVNAMVRCAARIIGISRVEQLLRYASFLAWQQNLAAVMLKQPFDLRHVADRDTRAPTDQEGTHR
jgi:hypothetical protein